MSKLQARTPRGMRDFLPAEMHKREFVMHMVRDVFESFGFEPIYTPVMELHSTLMGKYGEDAEQLIYHARHSEGKEELALRYDLTVPLSRFFAEHESDLPLPFRRYHIAPVWRGERPGRGRYREFFQCDADIVGIRTMNADAECVSLVYAVLSRLGFEDFTIKINSRKLLTGIGIYAGVADSQLGNLYRSIDKADKIGLDGVGEDLRKHGIEDAAVKRMVDLLGTQADHKDALLLRLREQLAGIDVALEGLRELDELADYLSAFAVPDERTMIDMTMVRGLGYYTGPIFETIITKPEDLGSVQGGGRYDDLIGMFRSQSLPTTGISLGIERIIDLMEQLDLYPPSLSRTAVQVLVAVFNQETETETLRLASELRQAGIRTEAYLDSRKNLGKQIGYADAKGVPLVVILGPEEIQQETVKLKVLAAGTEITLPRAELAGKVRELLENLS